MNGFVSQSLEPDVFWTALAAIGTLLAVAVALFMPTISRYVRNNRLERLISAEIRGNLQVIRKMTSRESRRLPDGREITAVQNNDALTPHIDLRLWRQYRYELAADRPHRYEAFHAVNRFAEAILEAPSEPAEMRMMVQTSEAQSFVDEFEKRIGSADA
ncbi:MAG: hypothetical protein ABEJ96_03525 [Thiohalorhabdaceae bacterium]